MKFFYINNSQCADCDCCSIDCPSGAVYDEDGKRYVDYEKCTACGGCLKGCRYDAVSFEDLHNLVRRMEKAELYLTRIRRLERELSLSEARLDTAEKKIRKMVEELPLAALVVGKQGRIVLSNRAVGKFLEDGQGADRIEGRSISSLFPGDISRIAGMSDGDRDNIVTTLTGKPVSVDISKLADGSLFCTITDLSEGNTAGEKALDLLREAIRRKMDMVQKIGTLLGDEASAEINGLNTAIKILEPGTQGPKAE